jgi:UDP-N-acetylmuramate: L-alanyl-gamma-D-glutamyl-meso-diaminopimelate ligase
VVHRRGVDWPTIAAGLAGFRGVARRQTVRVDHAGIKLVDDFAHHPTAVRETLAGLRARFPGARLTAIFEPRSATSSRAFFQQDYAAAFGDADRVIIAGVGRPEIPEAERLDVARLAADIAATGRAASNLTTVDAIVATLEGDARAGDVWVVMSNGGFGGIFEKLEAVIRARP